MKKQNFLNYFKANLIIISLVFEAILMVVSAGLVIFNKQIIDKNIAIQKHAEKVRFEFVFSQIDILRDVDVSLRGFAITKKESYLYIQPEQLKNKMEATFRRLDSLLNLQNYTEVEGRVALKNVQDTLRAIVSDHAQMVNHIRNGQDSLFMKMFLVDRGAHFLDPFNKAAFKVIFYEDELSRVAQEEYEFAVKNNIYILIFMVLFGLPSILLVIIRLRKESRDRGLLLKQLEDNNRSYLFDDGRIYDESDPKKIITNSISNLKKAADFITQIAKNNYNVSWEGINNANEAKNENNLVGKLIYMRDQMKIIKEDDSRRNWTNEGISLIGEQLRKHNNINELTDNILAWLIKYVSANQGMVFLVNDENSSDVHLELIGAYAFDRKKFINKKVYPGEGLAGQVWEEGETVYLSEIPKEYTQITSGLGGASPNNILIVPLKSDTTIVGILEIASFKIFEDFERAFVEKAAQIIASSFMSVKINERTQKLLIESQAQSEQLRQQEEEMRQSMEELQATQEGLQRNLNKHKTELSYNN